MEIEECVWWISHKDNFPVQQPCEMVSQPAKLPESSSVERRQNHRRENKGSQEEERETERDRDR